MANAILIITSSEDIHADIVNTKLKEAGASVFRLNLDQFPRLYTLGLQLLEGEWSGELVYSEGDTLRIDEIGAVWLRKYADFSFSGAQLSLQEQAYSQQEVEHILFGLLYGLDCYWMSHPGALRGALWKGEQLQRAARMGFQVPSSLISNQPSEARQFYELQEYGTVFKSLSSPFLGADKVAASDRSVSGIPTTRIEADDLNIFGAVRVLPSFFQQQIPKLYELRVTVIGDEVFAAKIHSQDDARTAVDYRDYSADILYEAVTLPDDITARCLAFVDSYNLTYGAIDLIVTPSGDYVFLENNPAGQFLFVEELVPELTMMDALTQCLLRNADK